MILDSNIVTDETENFMMGSFSFYLRSRRRGTVWARVILIMRGLICMVLALLVNNPIINKICGKYIHILREKYWGKPEIIKTVNTLFSLSNEHENWSIFYFHQKFVQYFSMKTNKKHCIKFKAKNRLAMSFLYKQWLSLYKQSKNVHILNQSLINRKSKQNIQNVNK
jgi:hypothetical protein